MVKYPLFIFLEREFTFCLGLSVCDTFSLYSCCSFFPPLHSDYERLPFLPACLLANPKKKQNSNIWLYGHVTWRDDSTRLMLCWLCIIVHLLSFSCCLWFFLLLQLFFLPFTVSFHKKLCVCVCVWLRVKRTPVCTSAVGR